MYIDSSCFKVKEAPVLGNKRGDRLRGREIVQFPTMLSARSTGTLCFFILNILFYPKPTTGDYDSGKTFAV